MSLRARSCSLSRSLSRTTLLDFVVAGVGVSEAVGAADDVDAGVVDVEDFDIGVTVAAAAVVDLVAPAVPDVFVAFGVVVAVVVVAVVVGGIGVVAGAVVANVDVVVDVVGAVIIIVVIGAAVVVAAVVVDAADVVVVDVVLAVAVVVVGAIVVAVATAVAAVVVGVASLFSPQGPMASTGSSGKVLRSTSRIVTEGTIGLPSTGSTTSSPPLNEEEGLSVGVPSGNTSPLLIALPPQDLFSRPEKRQTNFCMFRELYGGMEGLLRI